MWKASAGQSVKVQSSGGDDDWETDSDFVNNVSEKEQRWGSKSVEGSGKPAQALDLNQLRTNVTTQHEEVAKKEYNSKPGFSHGYGGKFGVQTDRMDKSAVGFDAMTAPSSNHSSIPKYERPAVASKPTDIKRNLEAASDTSVTMAKIEEARKQRADKDRVDRERIRVEQEAIRAQELAKAKDEAEKKRIADAQAKARADEERAKLEAEKEEARLAAEARRRIEEAARLEAESARRAEAQAQAAAVVESEPEPEPEAPPPVVAEKIHHEEAAVEVITATAVYEYEAGGDDELGFGEGDIITNIEIIDEGWWRGECNGRYGLFPANYVQRT